VDAVKSNRELIDQALRRLPSDAAREEHRRAMEAARAACGDCEPNAGEAEKLAAAVEAVNEVACQVRRRQRLDKWLNQVTWLLPSGAWATDCDKDQARAIMTKTLDPLPTDVSDWEIRETLKRALAPLGSEIKTRNRLAKLAEPGVAEVSIYLHELRHNDDISQEDYSELLSDLDNLKQLVREELEEKLTGDEDADEVRDLARDIVDDDIFEDDE